MRIIAATPDMLPSVVGFAGDPRVGSDRAQVEAELAAGRMRAEWTFVATDDQGELVGRAMWWGRTASAPLGLEVWDVLDAAADRGDVATRLLLAGHSALAAEGVTVPLPHTVRVINDWQDDDEVAVEVGWRIAAARGVGLTLVNERLQFEWGPPGRVGTDTGRLTFHPADDAEFCIHFADTAVGSLDVMTRRELENTSAAELARDEIEFYRSCPGDREWWRVARDATGAVVGIAIPSATPTSRNVGYLAVLPDHRGHGYVDDLLGFITRFHAGEGATRITATTDATNAPMAAAFRRAGYRNVETRIDLEAPYLRLMDMAST